MKTTVQKKIKNVKMYRSPAAASIHEMMEGLQAADAISKVTLQKFDKSCLTPVLSLEKPSLSAPIQGCSRRRR